MSYGVSVFDTYYVSSLLLGFENAALFRGVRLFRLPIVVWYTVS